MTEPAVPVARLPWLARNAMAAYGLLVLGVVLSFALSGIIYGRFTDRVKHQAAVNCQAGNDRSDVQREDILDSRRQLEAADLVALLGVTPEQADNLRRQSLEASDRRLARLPYVDCRTNKRIPPPAPG